MNFSRRPGERFNRGRVPIGGAALWTPADLGAKLGAWYQPESVVLNGGAVSSLLDLSGNGLHASQATPSIQPDYVASDAVLGGRPSLQGATNDYLFTDGSISVKWIAIVAHHPFTAFSAFDVPLSRGPASAAGFLVGDSGTANWATTGGATPGVRVRNGVTTNVALGSANEPFLYEFTVTTPASGILEIGNYQPSQNLGWLGKYAEIVALTSTPSAEELTAFRAYIASRYPV